MRVHVYSMMWNEESMVPFFLQHYQWCDRIVVYDNYSTDTTRELVAAAPNAEVRLVDTTGVHSEAVHLEIRNQAWKESRGHADWVLVVDADEFLFHHDLAGCLRRLYDGGVTVARCYGWQMISETFPSYNGVPLTEQVRQGVQHPGYSKPVLFRPEQLTETNFAGGAHDAKPTGNVVYKGCGSLALLHYKFLGWDYYWQRVYTVRERSDPSEVEAGWHSHTRGDREKHWENFCFLLKERVDVTT